LEKNNKISENTLFLNSENYGWPSALRIYKTHKDLLLMLNVYFHDL